MQPRYFIRRSFAFLIDFTLVAILMGLLAYVINGLTGGTRMIAPSVASYSICNPIVTGSANYLPAEKIRGYFPNALAEGDTQTQCVVSQMGLTSIVLVTYSNTKTTQPNVSETKSVSNPSDSIVETTITKTTGPSFSVTKSVSIAKDANDITINPFPGDALLLILLPLIAAMIISRFATTPGKRILGLYVIGMDTKHAGFLTAAKRETLKFLPFIVVGIFQVVIFLLVDPSTGDDGLRVMSYYLDFLMDNFLIFAVVAAVVSIALFWWQIGSFLRWTGQAYWDRFSDTQVLRST